MKILVDSHALAYRAHYALQHLSHDGGRTEVTFGFLSTLLDLSERYRSREFLFCWEGRGSKRQNLFPAYKQARRMKVLTPQEAEALSSTHAQMDTLRDEVLPMLGFRNILRQDGYEADDLIAAAIKQFSQYTFLIASSDNDMYQLLAEKNCAGQHALDGRLLHARDVLTKFGVPARDWASLKALTGCDGDGVPGIQGIGIKTAVKFMNGDLPADSVTYQRIKKNREIVYRNYNLVHLPFSGVAPIQLMEDRFDEKTALQTFDDLGFRSFLEGKNKDRWQSFFSGG